MQLVLELLRGCIFRRSTADTFQEPHPTPRNFRLEPSPHLTDSGERLLNLDAADELNAVACSATRTFASGLGLFGYIITVRFDGHSTAY